MKCSLIIPCYWINHETIDMTLKCLKSLKETAPQVHWLIVDDGSPHPFEEEIPSIYERRINGGYIAAINDGLRVVDGNILIVGNNDLVFSKGWLEALLKPLNLGYDISTIWTSDQKDVRLEDKIEDDAKFGSLFAMKREVYETLGGFDEQFRDYFGDLDYRRRALDAGFKVGKNLNFVVQHEAKATYKQVDPNDERYLRGQRLYEAKYGFVE